MEPGHEDREYSEAPVTEDFAKSMPQWSPVMKTGNTQVCGSISYRPTKPQWSPVMKTGNTPGSTLDARSADAPQWSPVMKTGNTRGCRRARPRGGRLNGARS